MTGAPPTLEVARLRQWLTESDAGIYTFSNGSAWEGWADANCFDCRYYDPDEAGAWCAFEAAAMLGVVSPALAKLFGWQQNPEYPECWDAPAVCPFFRQRPEDGQVGPEPDPDPNQFVLIADPTEPLAGVEAPEPAEVAT